MKATITTQKKPFTLQNKQNISHWFTDSVVCYWPRRDPVKKKGDTSCRPNKLSRQTHLLRCQKLTWNAITGAKTSRPYHWVILTGLYWDVVFQNLTFRDHVFFQPWARKCIITRQTAWAVNCEQQHCLHTVPTRAKTSAKCNVICSPKIEAFGWSS